MAATRNRARHRLAPGIAAATAAGIAAGAALAAARAEEPPALELVLAIDSSSSVSAEEFALQTGGIAQAFRHPDVAAAIRAAGPGGIAVALVQWSGNRMQRTAVDWMRVTDAAGAGRFAAAVEGTRRLLTGATGLGGAIRFALRALEENGLDGRRLAIDVSGDGHGGISPRRERDRARARGVTINGLAIENEEPDLGRYYAEHVIAGPGAFVLTVAGYEDVAAAMREKLIREIGALEIARADGAGRRR